MAEQVDPYAEARKKRRKPVKVGDRLPFHSTLHGTDGKGILVRNYSDQKVEVVSFVEKLPGDDPEPLFAVRANNGVEFAACEGGRPRGATIVATQRNRLIRSHYQQLLSRGKTKMTALVACMRKLLLILNAMIKNQTPWKEVVAS